MKKKHLGQPALFNIRTSIRLLVYAAALSCMLSGTLLAFSHSEAPTKASRRNLTFAERVADQRAIEEVYWRHRIWPKERLDSKPSLDAVMSQAQLESKVADYLRTSQTLEAYWQRPLTAEQLQAEMERIARDTKQPEVLREIFQALGDDAFIIAECLARPILAQRLITELHNEDRLKLRKVVWPREQFAATSGTEAPVTLAALNTSYRFPLISGRSGGCTDDTWTPTSITNAPSARSYHTAVWTGNEMIIWGGLDNSVNYVNTGGRYDPSTDSWIATSTTNAPSARGAHTAVWTGSEMIVWGGYASAGASLNTGGRYDPSTNSWTTTSTANAPAARGNHTAVWSGSEMIVWGGKTLNSVLFNTGGRYNPTTDSWTATSTTEAPVARAGHTAVWTGSEMIVWGGDGSIPFLATGGRYNPGTDSWIATAATHAPPGRDQHTAVWTGNEMIVWGGEIAPSSYGITGGRYDPGTNSWTATSTTNTPYPR